MKNKEVKNEKNIPLVTRLEELKTKNKKFQFNGKKSNKHFFSLPLKPTIAANGYRIHRYIGLTFAATTSGFYGRSNRRLVHFFQQRNSLYYSCRSFFTTLD